MKSGVYSIRNRTNNKQYIGSSKDILQRLRQHRNQLKYGIHCNKHLQSSYNKYGLDNFEFTIIERCEDYINKEIYYVEHLNVLNPKHGYNKATIILDTSGYKWSDESRKKLSNSKKGTKMHPNTLKALIEANKNRIYKKGKDNPRYGISPKHPTNKKPILQYDLSGNFIKEYGGCIDVKEYGFYPRSVGNCCHGLRNHSGGFIWRFKTEENIEQKITPHFTKRAKIKQFECIQYNLNIEFGELLEHPEEDNQQPSINLND